MFGLDQIATRLRSYHETARQRRLDRATYRAVSDLPPHLLKDLGWPSAYERQRNRRS